MKTKEEWHHTKKFVDFQRKDNPNWTCNCTSCKHVEAIQQDAITSVTIKPPVPDLTTGIDQQAAGVGFEEWWSERTTPHGTFKDIAQSAFAAGQAQGLELAMSSTQPKQKD